MGKLVEFALYHAKNLFEVKAIVESFEGSGILVTQGQVSSQTAGFAPLLLEINDQYERLVKMESAKYTIKERRKQSKNLTLRH